MDLIKDLTCPVCLELLNRPVILPCSHVLCQRPCAETIFGVSFVRCPVCREHCGTDSGFRNLSRVLAIENIIEKVRMWQNRTEINQTKTATSQAPNLTNDSGHSTMYGGSGSPITSSNNSSKSLNNEFNITEVEMASINQNNKTNQTTNPCEGCINDTVYPSAAELRTASNLHRSRVSGISVVTGVSGVSEISGLTGVSGISEASRSFDCSSSEMTLVTLTSFIKPPASQKFYSSNECPIDQARKIQAAAQMKSQVQEQLRKLSETQRQLLDTVASYRKHAHVHEDREMALVQTAPSILNRLSAVLLKCNLCMMTFDSRIQSTQNTIDRAQQRDVAHAATPSQPIIDTRQSTRSHNSVALVICPPPSWDDINSYQVTYFSDEHKHQQLKKHQNAKWFINPTSVCNKVTFVLIEGLSNSTNFYFSACAVNSAGSGPTSDNVKCRTLSQHHCVVPVPIIMNLFQATATSATITCPSPRLVTRSQGVTHFILYRRNCNDYIWQGEELLEAEEHKVECLEPDRDYQFVVLACNLGGECQISQKMTLKTGSVQQTD